MSIGLLLILVVVGSTIWVGVDASKRDWGGGSGTATWVVGCLLLWIVVFPVYLSKRNRAPLKAAEVASDGAGEEIAMYRECPRCKEAMRRDADTCPHCQKTSTPWRLHEGRWWYRESDDEPWQWYDEERDEWFEPATPPMPAEG